MTGHHDWAQTFHRTPKLVDSTMEKLGGTRIAPLGLSDAAQGDMFTDFETRPIAAAAQSNEPARNGGKFLFRSGRPSSVRVGAGGPTYSFKTLNGEIYVRKGAR